MPRSGGNYNLPAGNPVVVGTVIDPTWANTTLADIGGELTNSVPRDGQAPPTANLPMGGFKHTGVAAAAAATEYLRADQGRDSTFQWLTSVSDANNITAVVAPAMGAYVAGQAFRFQSVGTSVGPVTLNINGLGARDVTRDGTTPLEPGDIPTGTVVTVVYDGVRFQLVNPLQKRTVAFTGTVSVTVDTTLAAADGYQMYLAGGGGTFFIALPDSSTIPDGWYVRIVNNGSILTVTRSGPDTIVGPGLPTAGVTAFTLPYTGSGELGYNFGAVTLYKFGTTWRPVFDSPSHGSQLFASSGTWVCPFGVNTVWLSGAGGGGGGGGASNVSNAAAGGGGGGASVIGAQVTVVPGTSYTVTIGAGGAGGNNTGTNGATGGATSFGALATYSGGAGGTGSTGGATAGGAAGGAGGAPGTTASVLTGIGLVGGGGGGAIFAPAVTTGLGQAAVTGAGFGGGGSGAIQNNAGAAGAPGFLLVRW
jgi:hypothetical protein